MTDVTFPGPMAGKTVLVTGGTTGIGRSTAVGLAAMGAHLAIVGRDRRRTEDAAREICAAGGSADAFVADLSVQSEVRRLAGEVLSRDLRIHVLVNNVGGFWNTRHVTADGLERTFALNHLAPFLLTNLLLDRLRQCTPSRVVTVSSNAQAMGRIDFDDLQGERSYSGARAYNQSKLANVLFSYELAKRLRGSGVTANALHPGVVRTSFGAEDPRRPAVAGAAHRAVHEDTGPGRGDVDSPGIRSRARTRDRRLLRQRQTQEVGQAQLRRSHLVATVAGKRGSGRHLRQLRALRPQAGDGMLAG